MIPILDIDFEKARKTFDINVFAPFNVTKAFMPLLIASKGTVVNIGSYVDSLPLPWGGVYNASKAALRSLTDNLRLEVKPFGVKVIYVCLLVPLFLPFLFHFLARPSCLLEVCDTDNTQVAAGGIRSNFLSNLEPVKLAPTSLYYPGRAILEPELNYESVKSQFPRRGMLPEVFAKEVFEGATTGKSEYRVYAGTQTPLSKLVEVERVSFLLKRGGLFADACRMRFLRRGQG